MALTDGEKTALRELGRRLNSVAFVVHQVAERTLSASDKENIPGLDEALADCRHEIRIDRFID